MADETGLPAVAERLEGLLAELGSALDPSSAERAQEAIRLLMELYGGGLERIVGTLAETGEGRALLERLTHDDLVGSLLSLHGLHPVPLEQRVEAALDQVRPYLGSHAGGVEYRGVDEGGVVHLRLQGTCDGCPSSTVTVTMAIERAIMQAAPEVTRIEVEGMTDPGEPKLLQIQPSPGRERPPARWTPLNGHRPARNAITALRIEGVDLVLCDLDGSLVAYRDACGACGGSLRDASLEATTLRCASCEAAFDVRAAGRGDEGNLEPVPLIQNGDQARIAIEAGVGG